MKNAGKYFTKSSVSHSTVSIRQSVVHCTTEIYIAEYVLLCTAQQLQITQSITVTILQLHHTVIELQFHQLQLFVEL